MIDETHDASARCWLSDADGHPDFPVQNLPLGVFAPAGEDRPRGGMAIGDHILDLGTIAALLNGDAEPAASAASADALNGLLGLGAGCRRALRRQVFALLTDPQAQAPVREALHRAEDCTLHLPARVGDYTDFYTGIHHATNVGRQFRPENPLLPNYKYVPIGYHGRASSIRVSGAAVRRPSGQTKPPDAAPRFGPSARLDYELELGVWIGEGNALGAPIPVGEAGQAIAGLCLLNDWSARDIQGWEYQPLGPFLSKNFMTTVSPWIVTAEALEPFRTAQAPRPHGDPAPLPYLLDPDDQAHGAFELHLEVHLSTQAMRAAGEPFHRLSRGSAGAMYWTAAQLVAHHTSNGCDLRPGDLLGTGTLSGEEPTSFGSLLELSKGGSSPLTLPNSEQRSFLEDGDELRLAAYGEKPGYARIGFGACSGQITAP